MEMKFLEADSPLLPVEAPADVAFGHVYCLGYWRYNWGNREDRYYPQSTDFTLDRAKRRAELFRLQGTAFHVWVAPMLVFEYSKVCSSSQKAFGICPTGWATLSSYEFVLRDMQRSGGWNFWQSFSRHASKAILVYSVSQLPFAHGQNATRWLSQPDGVGRPLMWSSAPDAIVKANETLFVDFCWRILDVLTR